MTTEGPDIGSPHDDGANRRYGVVLFDDEKDPRGAWVAINGGTPRRIDGINELPTDTLWWSNLSYEAFRSTKADLNPWLRFGAYMVLNHNAVMAEWGMDPATTSPDHTAKFCSMVFQRIMTMAWRLMQECEPNIRYINAFSKKTLREDLRRLVPGAEYPKGSAAAVMRNGQVYADFTKTMVRNVFGGKTLRLQRPRVSYAVEMLTTPVPKGNFEFYSKRALRELSPDRVAWVRSQERPCLTEINVLRMEGDISTIYGFGNSTDKSRATPRSWAAHPEFLTMSTFSELDVQNVYIGERYAALNLDLPEPVRKFLGDRHTDNSWSAGILAETLWRAATLSEERTRFNASSPEERPDTSWRGAWVRAADKVAMFATAMQLSGMGYSVVSYGSGWVSVSLMEDQIPDLIRDGLTCGLLPRLSDIPKSLFGTDPNVKIPWQGDKRSLAFAQMTSTWQKNFLWNLDRLPLYDKAEQDGVLKRIVKAFQEQNRKA